MMLLLAAPACISALAPTPRQPSLRHSKRLLPRLLPPCPTMAEGGFSGGFRSTLERLASNFVEARSRSAAELKQRWSQPPAPADASRLATVAASALVAAVVVEALSLGALTLGAWAFDLALAPGRGRLSAAAGAAWALRREWRSGRLVVEVLLAPLLFAAARRERAPISYLRERCLQAAAVAACALLTLRALDRGPLAALSLSPAAALAARLGAPALEEAPRAAVSAVADAAAAVGAAARALPLSSSVCGGLSRIASTEDVAVEIGRRALAAAWALYEDSWLRIVLRQLRGVLLQTLLG